jgi:hypothetical protein
LCGGVFKVQNNWQDLQLALDEVSGLVKTITKEGVEMPLEQNFYYYQGASAPEGRMSGAYIFRPDGSGIYRVSTRAEVTVYKGKCYNWFIVESVFNSQVDFGIHLYIQVYYILY